MSGHSILQIIKGVQKVPGDTRSAEQGLDTVDLLDPLGFSTDTYEMKIPALKSSAVYADSPLTDGRTLIAGTLGNVTETIRVTLTAGTIVQMSAMLSKLLRFKQDCNDFWDTNNQIEPVYIKHQVSGEPGPRYALLYDIDIAIDPVINPGDPTRDLTIVIERETYWRGLAPGDNPRKWTIEQLRSGLTWGLSNAALETGSDHAVYASITNKLEFQTENTFLTRNFVDIPASVIPGDAPALYALTVKQTSVNDLPIVYAGKVTRPTTVIDRSDGTLLPHYNSFSGAVGNLGVDTTLNTDANGIIYTPTSGLARTARISFATAAAINLRVTWAITSGSPHLSVAVLRGRYAVFLRARQNGGAAGNTSIRVDFIDNSNVFFTSTVAPIISTSVPLAYLGEVVIPTAGRTFVGMNGYGQAAANDSNYAMDFTVQLYAARSTGVATLDIFDLILFPIDEGMFQIIPQSDLSSSSNFIIFDNTSYFTHGRLEDFGEGRNQGGLQTLDKFLLAELKTYGMTLTPKVNNRLYFILQDISDLTVAPPNTADIRINIIPRWSGLRDV